MASNVYEKLKRGGELGARACALDREDPRCENVTVVFQTYMVAIDHLEYCYKYAPTPHVKKTVIGIMTPYMERAEELKEVLTFMREQSAQAQRNAVGMGGGAAGGGGGDGGDARPYSHSHSKQSMEAVEERGNPELRKALQSALLDDRPSVRLDDVVGLEEAKKALNLAVVVPLQAPQLYTGSGMKPWNGILLYGPPGTGKTFIAKAVAGECGATFFSITSSNIREKWVGQSEKMVAELFSMARERRPSIIFIDEIEALLPHRGRGGDGGGSTHDDKLVTEFLSQMQGVKGSNEGVLVLGATNLPWVVDDAARRRFQRRVYVPLPETLQRAEMFLRGFGDTFSFTKELLEELSSATTMYSGSDIDTLVQSAKSITIDEVMCAVHFKPDPRNQAMFVPCTPNDPGARAMTFVGERDKTKFAAAPIQEHHIRRALHNTKPSVDPETLPEYEEWTAKFGVGGAE